MCKGLTHNVESSILLKMANNTNNTTTFKKRAGTTDKGKQYEDLMVAYLILKLVKNDSYSDFKISANDDSFGAFDDVVLELEEQVRYGVQLKHFEKEKLISLASLEASNGDFSVKKYFDSYRKQENLVDFKLVLYTNRKFKLADNTCIKLEVEGETFEAVIVQATPEPLLLSNQNSQNCYQFEIVKNERCMPFTQTLAQFEDFLNVFYLYPNQANVVTLENELPNIMCNLFSCEKDLTDKYLKFINKWSELDGEKDKLSKKIMQERLALYLTASSIHPIVFGPVSENAKILQEAISKFPITIFDNDKVEQVKRIWGDFTDKQFDLKVLNLEKKKYQINCEYVNGIPTLSDEDRSSFLWLMNKCPLIVSENSQVYEAIKLCKNKIFVVMRDNDNNKNNKLGHLQIFESISDLASFVDVKQNVLKKFNCLLPGMTVNLEYLIKESVHFEDSITTNELIEMVESPYKIPWEPEKLSTPYIHRSISCPHIDIKYLDSISTTTIIISNVVTEKDKALLKNFELIDVKIYLNDSFKKELKIEMPGKRNIYFSENVCSQQLLQSICRKTENTQYHHFKLCNATLRWMKSTKNVFELEKYVLTNNLETVKESEILSLNEENNVHLIADGPGVGKTLLMKSIKNRISPTVLTIYFTIEDILAIYRFFKKNGDTNLEDFILNLKYSKVNDFAKLILKMLIKAGNVIYIWDALDETSQSGLENEVQTITNIIERLAKNQSVHWLTCRTHLKNYLEKKLNVLSKSLSNFTDQEKSNYIKKRLSSVFSPEELQELTQKIKINMGNNEDILGIPLQIFMITELFRRDTEKYCNVNQEIFRITDMYKYFVEEQIKLYFNEKLKCQASNSDYQINHFKDLFIEKYEKLALRLILESDFLEDLRLCDNFFGNDGIYSIGLVTEGAENSEFYNKEFVHISYGEYFVATYFARQIIINEAKFVKVLPRHIFKAQYMNVRFFFDMILAENSPAHVAVLYKNLKKLKKCDEKTLLEKDAAGRNILQIACSWGERYPILSTKKVKDSLQPAHRRSNLKFVIEDEMINQVKRESSEYVEQLEFLLTKCDFEVADDIFQLDSLQYAEKCECFYTIAIIDIDQECGYFKNKDFNTECSLLYYSVKHGYCKVFDLFENVKYVETNSGNLLHIAVENDQIDCLRILLSITMYAKMINFGYNGVTPLFLACSYGRLEMTNLLLSSGADGTVTARRTEDPITMLLFENELGWNPLHAAAYYGYEEIVKQLLDKQKDNINAIDVRGWTPIHLAAFNNHVKIVHVLIKSGAKCDAVDKDGRTPLHLATHIKVIELLVKSDADINAITNNGWTALHVASSLGHYEAVEFVVKSVRDINAFSKDRFTALHMAILYGHVKVTELLIKSGADINAIAKDEWTTLHIASQNGLYKAVELLVKSINDINAVNKDNYTALHIASQHGHVIVIDLLIKSGADINATANDGLTALHLAFQYGQYEAVELLVKSVKDINAVDKNSLTTLHLACMYGHVKVVKFLIKSGADNQAVANGGLTALHMASHYGQHEAVEALVKSVTDISACDNNSCTALHLASMQGHVKVIDLLIKSGANINAKELGGNTPLHMASAKGHNEVVELLIQSGADINAKGKYDFTPLHAASRYGHEKIVELLLKLDVDINGTAINSETALHIAACSGHVKVVDLLIKFRPEIDLADKDASTPLITACCRGHYDIVKILLQFGADINIIDYLGLTPLGAAIHNNHKEIAQYLIAHGADEDRAVTNFRTPLYHVCEIGHLEDVKSFIKMGASVETVVHNGWRAIHIACYKGYEEIVKELIKAGADVNVPTKVEQKHSSSR